jgi:hypothetical protein
MQNQGLGLTWSLYGQRDGVAGMAADVGFVRSNLGDQRTPIDRSYAVASVQASLRGGASFHHIINRERVRSRVIVRVVSLIEAELDHRAWITHTVHPQGSVKDRDCGKRAGNGGEERSG